MGARIIYVFLVVVVRNVGEVPAKEAHLIIDLDAANESDQHFGPLQLGAVFPGQSISREFQLGGDTERYFSIPFAQLDVSTEITYRSPFSPRWLFRHGFHITSESLFIDQTTWGTHGGGKFN